MFIFLSQQHCGFSKMVVSRLANNTSCRFNELVQIGKLRVWFRNWGFEMARRLKHCLWGISSMSSDSSSDIPEALSGNFSISGSQAMLVFCDVQVSACLIFLAEVERGWGSDSTSGNVEGRGAGGSESTTGLSTWGSCSTLSLHSRTSSVVVGAAISAI